MDFAPASFSADDVLQVLDEQMPWFQVELDFAMLEDYVCRAGAHMSVFRSRDGRFWVMCIESIYYDARAEAHILGVYMMGNCLCPPSEKKAAIERVLYLSPMGGSFPDGHEFYGSISRQEFSIQRHGRHEVFRPTPEDYARAGLRWTEEEAQGVMTPQDMLRFLCAHFGDEFFASDDTMRDLLMQAQAPAKHTDDGGTIFCGYKYEFGEFPFLPHELGLFLQTKDWTHPRWNSEEGNSQSELWPQVEAMRPLAEAIVSGDLTVWNAQDPSVFNSHWSRWTTRALEEELQHQFLEQALALQESALTSLDEHLQVLTPDALKQFEQEALAVITEEDLQPPEAGEATSETMSTVMTSIVRFWIWNDHAISTSVLREWLRRRANRSEDSP